MIFYVDFKKSAQNSDIISCRQRGNTLSKVVKRLGFTLDMAHCETKLIWVICFGICTFISISSKKLKFSNLL